MKTDRKTQYKLKFYHYIKNITVEPTLVLYMLAFMSTSVVEPAFYIYKACTVNHGFNKTVCDNINDPLYKNLIKEVQSTTAKFQIWNSIASYVVPVVLALFMGSWSDKRGRKLPLLIGLSGKLFFSVMIVVNTLRPNWPVEYIIYSATLPSALAGGDVAITAAAFTYIIDISSLKYRTMRVTILEVCYLATMPIGVALGVYLFFSNMQILSSYLFKSVFNNSFTYMFLINTTLIVLSIIYSFLRLNWRTNSKQRPLSEAGNKFLDFFDYNHLISTVNVISRKRLNHKRTYLLVLIFMMACYTFQRDEKELMYMYCQLVFNWTFQQFSTFRSIQSAIQDVILLIAIPVMSRLLGWRDTVIIMIGATAHATARIFYANAEDAYVIYAGGVFASFGPIVAPVIRSLVSKIVSDSEKGKAFSVLGIADNATPLIAGTSYSILYNATLHSNPSAIFYLTMATQLTVFCLIMYIHLRTKKDDFEVNEEKPQIGELD